MPITQDVYHEIVVDVDQRDYGVTVGEPPNIFLTEFRPGRTYNGAPPTYEGPSVRHNPSGSEDPVQIVDINGQAIADLPAGTKVYQLLHGEHFEYGIDPTNPGNTEPNNVMGNNFYITPDGSEGGVFKVTLPPERLDEHSRQLKPSEPQHIIVSVDRKQLRGRENIPFPQPELWVDHSLPNLVMPENESIPIFYDLLKSGDYIYILRQTIVPEENGGYRDIRQTVYWDTEKNEWIFLQEGELKPGDITKLANGAVLINEVEVNQVNPDDVADKAFRTFHLYQPKHDEPGFDLIRQWRLSDEYPEDFVLSPEGRKLLAVDIDPHRFDYERYMSGVENGYSIYLSIGSEPADQLLLDGQAAPRSGQTRIADLPADYNGDPRITVSQDGNTVAVVSQYSAQFEYVVDGVTVTPDYRTIHGREGGEVITASMITVAQKGADGQWHTHYVPLPEGWGMSGRFLLSWEPDGNLRISQFDNTKQEGDQWSHHYVNTSVLDSGILPHETFFVSDPTDLVFRDGILTFTDSNGETREFVIGYQPEDGRLDQLLADFQRAYSGDTLWFTYNSDLQTLSHATNQRSLGFASFWIKGAPNTLPGVTYSPS